MGVAIPLGTSAANAIKNVISPSMVDLTIVLIPFLGLGFLIFLFSFSGLPDDDCFQLSTSINSRSFVRSSIFSSFTGAFGCFPIVPGCSLRQFKNS
ncbi:unnamed protein product [Meloidogyne enterolobii]|uniref:Uncharacterized protein n=1 Tax=Meloidogyne enterolobii TaxID=390850 RepID=A0ACB0XXV5_MELEN